MMNFFVNQSDIDNGEKNNCAKCPIANAIKRAYPLAQSIEVGTNFISITNSHKEETYSISNYVKKFIKNFDSGEKVLPFYFTLLETSDSRQ